MSVVSTPVNSHWEQLIRQHARLKEIIWLYYWEDWSMQQIGQFYGVTESRISQLHTKALTKLRSMLDPQLGQFLA